MNITAELFKQYVGREPEDDDLERCNCEKAGQAGQAGHMMCGWNSKENLPVYMVGRVDES
jgi:hypothetical protein